MDTPVEIVTAEAAAQLLGVSRMQITRLVRAGALRPLPFRPIRGRRGRPPYRFPQSEIERYLSDRDHSFRERDAAYVSRFPRMAFYPASA